MNDYNDFLENCIRRGYNDYDWENIYDNINYEYIYSLSLVTKESGQNSNKLLRAIEI